MSALKCKSCGGSDIAVVEEWRAFIEFEPGDYDAQPGAIVLTGDGYKDVGDPTGALFASCSCGERWHLRRKSVRAERTEQ